MNMQYHSGDCRYSILEMIKWSFDCLGCFTATSEPMVQYLLAVFACENKEPECIRLRMHGGKRLAPTTCPIGGSLGDAGSAVRISEYLTAYKQTWSSFAKFSIFAEPQLQ